jgi:hypothetical protein
MAEGKNARLVVTKAPHLPRWTAAWAQALAREMFDPYRPELHYMRGPGPKWREKHGLSSAPSACDFPDQAACKVGT